MKLNEPIFVFGSNLAGIHGAGAARYAYENCGAEWGVGEGLTGNSYAIPTKDENIQTRRLRDVAISIQRFIEYAHDWPQLTFHLTPVGTGLAGFSKKEIWNVFRYLGIPSNVLLTSTWMTD